MEDGIDNLRDGVDFDEVAGLLAVDDFSGNVAFDKPLLNADLSKSGEDLEEERVGHGLFPQEFLECCSLNRIGLILSDVRDESGRFKI